MSLAAATVTHIPLLFLQTPLQLVIARAAFGLGAAAMQPAIVRLLKAHAPPGMDARAISYGQSFMFMAMGLAPFVAGLIGPVLGLRAYFALTIVLMAGAGATLLAQWGLIPFLGLGPRPLVLWGSALAAAGTFVTGCAAGTYGITLGFGLASLGFGFFRPGFTSGASLAVGEHEQNAIAGMVTSVNGIAYVAAPAVAVALYEFWKPLPFVAVAVLMAGLVAWGSFRLTPAPSAA